MSQFLLVHSPFLGPYSWAPVADLLRAEGHRVVVPDLRPALAGPPPYLPRLRDAAAAVAGGRWTLVGHSAAGPLMPAIAEALGPSAAEVVLVDARLPHPGLSWLDSVGEERAAKLHDMATDGVLPPWDTWFPDEVIAREVPDPVVRERLRAGIRPLPFALCTETAPSLPDRIPYAYVRLSQAYDGCADTAERAGWRVVRVDSVHLAPLSRPTVVVDAIHEVISA